MVTLIFSKTGSKINLSLISRIPMVVTLNMAELEYTQIVNNKCKDGKV